MSGKIDKTLSWILTDTSNAVIVRNHHRYGEESKTQCGSRRVETQNSTFPESPSYQEFYFSKPVSGDGLFSVKRLSPKNPYLPLEGSL